MGPDLSSARTASPAARGAAARASMRDYHDTEWGNRVHGEAAYLERLTLEAFQSGLSWSTILNKREAFREVFHGFDADAIAAFGEDDEARLMQDARHRPQPRQDLGRGRQRPRHGRAARATRGWRRSCCPSRPSVPPAPATTEEMQTTSPESLALSKALKKRGFAFVGPTTMFALMEAIGVFDPHLVGCFRRGDLSGQRRTWRARDSAVPSRRVTRSTGRIPSRVRRQSG